MNIKDLIDTGLELQEKALRFGLDLLGNTFGDHGSCCDCCGSKCQCGRWDSNADIKLETRLGETRKVSFLVENNRSTSVNVEVTAGPLIDSDGKEFQANWVSFNPQKFTLKPCECQGVEATLLIKQPLQADKAYYTEFRLDGCPTKPITIGVLVQAADWYDYYTQCDDCKPRKGSFIEYCECDCCGCCINCTRFYRCEEVDQRQPQERITVA